MSTGKIILLFGMIALLQSPLSLVAAALSSGEQRQALALWGFHFGVAGLAVMAIGGVTCGGQKNEV